MQFSFVHTLARYLCMFLCFAELLQARFWLCSAFGFEVDHQRVFGVLFDGEVNRLGSLENSSGVCPYLPIRARGRSPITHQPTAFGEISDRIDRRHCVA